MDLATRSLDLAEAPQDRSHNGVVLDRLVAVVDIGRLGLMEQVYLGQTLQQSAIRTSRNMNMEATWKTLAITSQIHTPESLSGSEA